MSRRAGQGRVSYKEVDSDGETDVLTDDEDRLEALKEAATLLARRRKGNESSDDAYEPSASGSRGRESRTRCC